MKKVLVLLADGFEEIEALSVIDVLRRANIVCELCSIEGEYVRGTHDIIIKSDSNINEINKDEYDAVVLPGGLPGAHNLKLDIVKKLVLDFNNKEKIVAAICAAPETLEHFGILDDKKSTSYPGFVKDRAKVNYIEDQLVVVDKNIITSRGPATALVFALEILKVLGYEKGENDIKEGMMINFYNRIKM